MATTSCAWIFPVCMDMLQVSLIVFVMTFGGKQILYHMKTIEPESPAFYHTNCACFTNGNGTFKFDKTTFGPC
jgi:hypothetical protein